jgi:hypothetical protein
MSRAGFIALLLSQLPFGCSAGGTSDALVVGKVGTGGTGSGTLGSGGAFVLQEDGGLGTSNALSAHIESPPGTTVSFVTLSCTAQCAEVLAIAEGGHAPYTFAWEDGSTNPERHVCPSSSTSYKITVTDSGYRSPEFSQDPQTVEASVTANVLDCSRDGGSGGSMGTDAGAGGCDATVLDTITPSIVDSTVSYFSGGTPLPAGRYAVAYADGCIKYDPSFGAWTVNGQPTFEYLIVGDTTTSPIAVAPGTFSPSIFIPGGFATFDECVTANLAQAPYAFDFAGGKLGVYNNDFQPKDNVAGTNGRNPAWSLARLACR